MEDSSNDKEEFGKREYTPHDKTRIQSLLGHKLGSKYLATRVGPGGTKLTYLEGWQSIEIANDIFGYNGWSDSICELNVDYCDFVNGKWNVGVSSIVKVMLQDGTFHEDIGYGDACLPSRSLALGKAKKAAVTDARKRALRLFGNILGNCVYDKTHIVQVKKIPNNNNLLESDTSIRNAAEYSLIEDIVPGSGSGSGSADALMYEGEASSNFINENHSDLNSLQSNINTIIAIEAQEQDSSTPIHSSNPSIHELNETISSAPKGSLMNPIVVHVDPPSTDDIHVSNHSENNSKVSTNSNNTHMNTVQNSPSSTLSEVIMVPNPSTTITLPPSINEQTSNHSNDPTPLTVSNVPQTLLPSHIDTNSSSKDPNPPATIVVSAPSPSSNNDIPKSSSSVPNTTNINTSNSNIISNPTNINTTNSNIISNTTNTNTTNSNIISNTGSSVPVPNPNPSAPVSNSPNNNTNLNIISSSNLNNTNPNPISVSVPNSPPNNNNPIPNPVSVPNPLPNPSNPSVAVPNPIPNPSNPIPNPSNPIPNTTTNNNSNMKTNIVSPQNSVSNSPLHGVPNTSVQPSYQRSSSPLQNTNLNPSNTYNNNKIIYGNNKNLSNGVSSPQRIPGNTNYNNNNNQPRPINNPINPQNVSIINNNQPRPMNNPIHPSNVSINNQPRPINNSIHPPNIPINNNQPRPMNNPIHPPNIPINNNQPRPINNSIHPPNIPINNNQPRPMNNPIHPPNPTIISNQPRPINNPIHPPNIPINSNQPRPMITTTHPQSLPININNNPTPISSSPYKMNTSNTTSSVRNITSPSNPHMNSTSINQTRTYIQTSNPSLNNNNYGYKRPSGTDLSYNKRMNS